MRQIGNLRLWTGHVGELEGKGYSASETVGGTLVYRATLSREDLLERRLKDAAVELCDGAEAPLVFLALVQGNRFTTDELDRIRRIIDDARKEKGKSPKPGK
jgi:BlaI family transcriptional regulator, penicillinase repressor